MARGGPAFGTCIKFVVEHPETVSCKAIPSNDQVLTKPKEGTTAFYCNDLITMASSSDDKTNVLYTCYEKEAMPP